MGALGSGAPLPPPLLCPLESQLARAGKPLSLIQSFLVIRAPGKMPLLPQWGKEHSVIMAGGSPCSVGWVWGGSGYYYQRGRTADPGRWGGREWTGGRVTGGVRKFRQI